MPRRSYKWPAHSQMLSFTSPHITHQTRMEQLYSIYSLFLGPLSFKRHSSYSLLADQLNTVILNPQTLYVMIKARKSNS